MGSLSNPVSNGPKCYFLSRLEPEYHTLLSPLINATKHLESFLTYTQIEISEQAFYENVHNNLIYFFKVLHFSCRMLVENAKCRDRIKGSGDVKRIQKVTCVLHDLLISLRWSFMKVEQKSKEYESVVSPRPVLGPNFSDVKDVVDGRAKVLVCRVIIEESLNILHMLERAILELAGQLFCDGRLQGNHTSVSSTVHTSEAMALEECPPTSPVTTAHDGEGENIPVTVPPDLTAWFEDIDTTEHTLIQPLSDIRAILTHFTNRFQVQALEIPLEGQQFPSLLTQADEFIALLNEATLTLHHPDLLDWFAGQPWESNKITFGNAWTAAKYMRLDFSYIIQMINERIKALEVKGDKEGLAMARELRQIFENADETVYMAHQTMNGHLESLKGLFPEAFDIEAEDLADPFWGRRGRKQEAAN